MSDFITLINQSLIELYDRFPDRIHVLTEPFVKTIKTLFLLVSELKVGTFIVRFEFYAEGHPLTVLFIGKEKQLDLLKRFTGTGTCTISRDTGLFFWKINSYLKKTEMKTDMTVIHLNNILYSFVNPEGHLRMPDFVKSQLQLNGTFEDTVKNFHESAVRKCRIVLRAGYTYEIYHDVTSLKHFYHEMYVPYMKNRFKELAAIESYYKVRRLFRTGFLLIVRKGDRYLSGVVCRIKQDTFIFELVGIEHGSFQLVRESALDALYYYSILEALKRRCRIIDYGNSNPFLNDGLFLYKRKWGTVLMPNLKQIRQFGVKIHGMKNGGCRFIRNHYPIFFDKKGLAGLIFKDNTEPLSLKEIRRIENAYSTPGLDNLAVVSHSGFERNIEKNLLQDFSDRIKFITLANNELDAKKILSEL